MKKKRSIKWLPFVAVPVAALALIVVVNIWRPDGNSPGIVQKVTEPLTAKQVFAAARAEVDKTTSQLGVNTVYYQKALGTDYIIGCAPDKEYVEYYTYDSGDISAKIRTNVDGQVIESMRDSNGNHRVDESEHYFNQSAIKMDYSLEEQACPSPPEMTQAEIDADIVHNENIARAFGLVESGSKPLAAGGFSFLTNLRSGDIKKQAEVFTKLAAVDGWSVKQNVKRPDLFSKDVIELSIEISPWSYKRLYFASYNKAFLGFELRDDYFVVPPNSYIVLEQGIRPLSEAQKQQ